MTLQVREDMLQIVKSSSMLSVGHASSAVTVADFYHRGVRMCVSLCVRVNL